MYYRYDVLTNRNGLSNSLVSPSSIVAKDLGRANYIKAGKGIGLAVVQGLQTLLLTQFSYVVNLFYIYYRYYRLTIL